MRVIDADKLLELYETPKDMLEWDSFVVPIPVVRQNILDMPILDSIVFPQTIGGITYYSSEELIEWIKNQQARNREWVESYQRLQDEINGIPVVNPTF